MVLKTNTLLEVVLNEFRVRTRPGFYMFKRCVTCRAVAVWLWLDCFVCEVVMVLAQGEWKWNGIVRTLQAEAFQSNPHFYLANGSKNVLPAFQNAAFRNNVVCFFPPRNVTRILSCSPNVVPAGPAYYVFPGDASLSYELTCADTLPCAYPRHVTMSCTTQCTESETSLLRCASRLW